MVKSEPAGCTMVHVDGTWILGSKILNMALSSPVEYLYLIGTESLSRTIMWCVQTWYTRIYVGPIAHYMYHINQRCLATVDISWGRNVNVVQCSWIGRSSFARKLCYFFLNLILGTLRTHPIPHMGIYVQTWRRMDEWGDVYEIISNYLNKIHINFGQQKWNYLKCSQVYNIIFLVSEYAFFFKKTINKTRNHWKVS